MNDSIARISGPHELVRAIPHLVGFYPTESVVMVGLDDRGQVVVTARYDLGEPMAEDTLAAFARNGVRTVIVALYTEVISPDASEAIETSAAEVGITVADVLRVGRGMFRSLMCDNPECCPPEGTPITDEVGVFEATVVASGSGPLLTRDQLVEQFAPADVISETQLHAALGVQSLSAEEVIALATRGRWTIHSLTRVALALADNTIRDAAWLRIETDPHFGEQLWATIARRVPAPFNAPACFLAAWGAWRDGDGARAIVATERCLTSEPGYSAALMLSEVLDLGVNPTRLPPLV